MKTTSGGRSPPAASASRMPSSIGRPRMGTRVFGISSVRWRRREPRPAPMMMAFTAALLARPRQEVRQASAGAMLAHKTPRAASPPLASVTVGSVSDVVRAVRELLRAGALLEAGRTGRVDLAGRDEGRAVALAQRVAVRAVLQIREQGLARAAG